MYAIGEILLVMVGILLALQVNNLNEERLRNKAVKSHLKSLAEAIEHDTRELSISMEFNEFRFRSWQYMLKWADIPFTLLSDIPRPDSFIIQVWDKPYPDTLNKDLIDRSMEQINFAGLGMVFNYSAINEINNLGILSDIKDVALKKKISEYYYFLDWKFGDQQVNYRFKFAEDLKNYFRDKHGISCNYPPDPQRIFEVIKSDDRVVIMMTDLIMIANKHYWDTKDLKERGMELVGLLRETDPL